RPARGQSFCSGANGRARTYRGCTSGSEHLRNAASWSKPLQYEIFVQLAVEPLVHAMSRECGLLSVGISSIAQAVSQEIECQNHEDHRDHREQQPGIECNDADASSLGEKYPPAGNWRPQAEPEETQRGFAEDHPGYRDGRCGDEVRHKARHE